MRFLLSNSARYLLFCENAIALPYKSKKILDKIYLSLSLIQNFEFKLPDSHVESNDFKTHVHLNS